MTSRFGALKIVKQTNSVNSALVVFFHGSGDSGHGILEWIKFLIGDLAMPHVKFLFPTAPIRPYTPLNGESSNVWFDRYDITPDVPEHVETLNSVCDDVTKLIDKEASNRIARNRIVVGGFSMGGALALHLGYRALPGFAGVFALSSFLNNDSLVYDGISGVGTPLFMCHGQRDSLVPIEWGQTTFDKLKGLGVQGEFNPLKNTLHELQKTELVMWMNWIRKVLPENE